MTPPPTVQSGSPTPQTAVSVAAPAQSQAPVAPAYNQFEIEAAAQFPIPEIPQIRLGLSGRPHRMFTLGGSFLLSPVSRIGGEVHVGIRGQITPNIFIEGRVAGGLSYLNNLQRTTGRLVEDVTLSGLTVYVNPQVVMGVQVTNWLGFFASLGLRVEGPIDVHSMPTQLVSGESPVGGVQVVPTISLGIQFGAVSSRPQPQVEDNPPVARRPAPPTVDTTATQAEFERRVQERVDQVTHGMETARRERIERATDQVRERIRTVQETLYQLNGDPAHADQHPGGINLSNHMSSVFTQRYDVLLADAQASVDPAARQELQTQLSLLRDAIALNAQNEPTSDTEQSRALRTGLQLIYSNTGGRYRYGQRMVGQLTRLRDQLRSHHEDSLATEVDQTITSLSNYLTHSGEGLQFEDIQRNAQAIGQSMEILESIEDEYNLEGNTSWTELRSQLTQTRQDVDQALRTTQALGRFAAIFQGNTLYFGDQVANPAQALATMQRGIDFLQQMPTTDLYRGVTLEALRSRYQDYFSVLNYNLNYFISLHTPPLTTGVAARRQWFESVNRARDLLCQINPTHARCSSPLETPGTGSRTPRPAHSRTIAPTPAQSATVQPQPSQSRSPTPPPVQPQPQPPQPAQSSGTTSPPPPQPRVIRPQAPTPAQSNPPTPAGSVPRRQAPL